MTAAILSIGTELTRGEITNTNASWLAAELVGLGFEVVEHCTVDDDRARIIDAMKRLAATVDVIVATGGLGPTTDDLTADAAAQALGVGLVRDEASLERIRQRWAASGRIMPVSNEKQADFPAGADVIPNPVGTAPGFAVPLGRARFYFLPGVPTEMQHLFSETVVPEIARRANKTTHQVHLRTFGLAESQVGELLADVEPSEPGITLGYRATFPEIEVKVHARAATAAEAEARAHAVAIKVRERLGDAVFGDESDTYPAAVGRILRDRGLKIAIAESCTGGLLGALVTGVPGSSDYLLLDAVTYSNASKQKLLHVNDDLLRAYGAVSGEVAQAMAEGALRLGDADLAVAVSGIAGPGGGSEEKPVGTVWFGLARREAETFVSTRRLPGDRRRIQHLASYFALRLLARAAQGKPLDA
jgi:nicotinamide-nucleotide amidase